ncbi:MAG: hypothetical protein U0531_07870 [Dehalococcoidia bacterium]
MRWPRLDERQRELDALSPAFTAAERAQYDDLLRLIDTHRPTVNRLLGE